LFGVDGGWWDEPWVSVGAHDDGPSAVVDVVVTRRAEQASVVEVGGAALAPRLDVVGVAAGCGCPAFDAAVVADDVGLALGVGEEPFAAADVQWDAVTVGGDVGDGTVTAESPRVSCRFLLSQEG
jgi:hypothetical protein